MAPVEGGDGWGRPSGAPTGPPPGMPRFEAPPLIDPTMPDRPADRYGPRLPTPTARSVPLPPPPGASLHDPPGLPPGAAWWPPADARPSGPRPAPPGSMTRGWAWTALLLMSLLPIGIVLFMVAYVVGSTRAVDTGTDEADPEWIGAVAGWAVLAWALLSTVGAALSAVIGAVRARRRPHLPRAPIVSAVVWSFLAFETYLLVRFLVTSAT